MKSRSSLLILLVIFLSACAPKYNYVNSNNPQPEFDHITVVFDYLHFVDDVGKLFDYPEEKNQQQIKALKAVIETALLDKGFNGTIDFALISSGLGLNPENGFEHYVAGQLQTELLYPPFYFQSTYDELFQDQLIQSFASAQNIAFVPVSKKNQNYYANLRMESLQFVESEQLLSPDFRFGERVGVLHIRAVLPKVSFMKAMGVSVLTVGLTAGATGGAYIGFATPVGVSHSTGLLFDNQTGEVVWKNQAAGDLSRFGEQSKTRFFKELPALK